VFLARHASVELHVASGSRFFPHLPETNWVRGEMHQIKRNASTSTTVRRRQQGRVD
jgi:hypothetical protein